MQANGALNNQHNSKRLGNFFAESFAIRIYDFFVVITILLWYNKNNNYFGVKLMPSDKMYLNFVLEQLSLLEGISYRSMIGEYLIYYKGKLIGGIYDNRLLLKP